jgi:hypothetical protein
MESGQLSFLKKCWAGNSTSVKEVCLYDWRLGVLEALEIICIECL